MLNDTLAAALSKILNAERKSLKECSVKRSNMNKQVLGLMNAHGYIGSYEDIENGKGGVLKINLLGKINQCGAIKPRFSISIKEAEKWEKRFLPAKGFGIILISTNKGLMPLEEAKKKNEGGNLIAYCY
ncbi:MAG TPA: 30S ribosomal protein S8 [Candidatus Nanoarchaeia archaeon]|nr:30S ribosomal protein S8 [Candidatus Nanoarchaeia archaeon]